MAYTNQTPHYHLPQFLGSDKPTWLDDFNTAMLDIDTQVYALEQLAQQAVNTSDNAKAQSTTAINNTKALNKALATEMGTPESRSKSI